MDRSEELARLNAYMADHCHIWAAYSDPDGEPYFIGAGTEEEARIAADLHFYPHGLRVERLELRTDLHVRVM